MKKLLFILIAIFLTFLVIVYYRMNEVLAGVTEQILPNSSLTPGAVNPDITQANIKQNICNPKWKTGYIRPSQSYTRALKIKQIKQYGYKDTNVADYEEDHLISLELGGHPTDPKNLWPESYMTSYGAREKDKVENKLHQEVCNGTLTLKEAQRIISTDWLSYYKYRI